ncbi:hypothetical protein [Serratia sp. D1N4]
MRGVKFSLFLSLFFIFGNCNADDADQEAVQLCATIGNDLISAVMPNAKISGLEKETFLLLTGKTQDPNVSPDGSRATTFGHGYIYNKKLYTFDSLSVMTMNDNVASDVVTYLYPGLKNKRLGGSFYSHSHSSNEDVFNNLIFIGNAGDVIHAKVYPLGDKSCLSKFPEKITGNLVIQK